MSIPPTPAQTVGPFLSIGLSWADGPFVVAPGSEGAIRVAGRVFDGAGAPVDDGMVETWQPDPAGRFDGGFRGFARSLTGPDGEWEVVTRKPGPIASASGVVEAPHLDVSVFARGLLHRLVTRIYFGDEEAANRADPVLATVAETRRPTLVADVTDDGYRFDIHLQGAHETAFFIL